MIDRQGTTEIPELVINRAGKANSLTIELLADLATAIDEVMAAGARAIVLTGANGRFCAGADLEALTGTAEVAAFDAALAAVTDRIVAVPVCVVAAVERYAFGAGVDLAWSCDVVVVAAGARVAVPAARLGILYNPSALKRLHARVGSRALRQLLVAGREIGDVEIADVVVPAGHALTAAVEVATASMTGLADAIGATKRVLNDADMGIQDTAEWERIRQGLLASPERLEALRNRNE